MVDYVELACGWCGEVNDASRGAVFVECACCGRSVGVCASSGRPLTCTYTRVYCVPTHRRTEHTMTTYTCNCKACGGITFTAPESFISGTDKQVRDMTHNYAQMLKSPVFAPRLVAQGVEVA